MTTSRREASGKGALRRSAAPLVVGGVLAAAVALACRPATPATDARETAVRGAELLPSEPHQVPAGFDPGEGLGIFLGVQRFEADDRLAEVTFAVDDAIDLAHLFSLELGLISPQRVYLLIHGEAQKPKTQKRLRELRDMGATIRGAVRADLLSILDKEVPDTRPNGVLVVSLSCHGFLLDRDNQHYLAIAASNLDYIENDGVRVSEVLDKVAMAGAQRRIVFIDACQERLFRAKSSGTQPAPESTMSQALADAVAAAKGQTIFVAAQPGGYSFDDSNLKNGVFTAAVIRGLGCNAETDERGFITTSSLYRYVNQEVKSWVAKNRESSQKNGIWCSFADDLPLAECNGGPEDFLAGIEVGESYISGHLRNGGSWSTSVSTTICDTALMDIDGDTNREVIVGCSAQGDDHSKIIVLTPYGKRLWEYQMTLKPPYHRSGGFSDRHDVVQVGTIPGDGESSLFAVINVKTWYPSCLVVLDSAGQVRASFWHPGRIENVLVHGDTLFARAFNNDLRHGAGAAGVLGPPSYVLFALPASELHGQAPPYLGNVERNTRFLWYYALSEPGVKFWNPEVTNGGVVLAWADCGLGFYFNEAGVLPHQGRRDGFSCSSHLGLIKVGT